jgi:hypothetical protein
MFQAQKEAIKKTVISLLTSVKSAAANFCDSPYHLSLKVDTWTLIKRQPLKQTIIS